jgi:signal transduction histidine kinase
MATPKTKLLETAFNEFTKASDSIINYYGVLETQIKQLKKEIEEKNGELLKAKEYLYHILNSLPVGVAVMDKNDITFSNTKAEEMGSGGVLGKLQSGADHMGELKIGTGHFRWRKERLAARFEGKEVIVFEDVTEIERMKERLERDERLRAMGEMAARISHEIKNPLGSMELFLSMLQSEKLKPKEKEYVGHVLYGVKTIDRIINNILTYTRPKTLALKNDSLARVVEDVLDFMSVSARSREIEVTLSTPYDGTVSLDADLMKLVLMNFLSNAMEAIDRNGKIFIEIREDKKKHVLIHIKDSGAGMPEEVRKNIFNPFFTTKDKGVGLGLFIAHNIVKAHDGYIEVESAEGAGSSFFIYLPKDRT